MIHFYYGENTQARDEAVEAFVQDFVLHHGATAVEVIDTEYADAQAVIDSCTTVPFLTTRRLVVIRYISLQKELADKMKTIIERVADTTDVLFIETSIDRRSLFAKLLLQQANDVQKFESLEESDLYDWVLSYVQSLGASIERVAITTLIDRVGTHQTLLANELRKLSLVTQTITKKHVISMTHLTPKSSVFSMLDALSGGNVSEATRIYNDQRAQNVEPQVLLSMIAWQLHSLALIKSCDGESVDTIAKKTKINPFVVRKNMSLVRKLSKPALAAMLTAAIEADANIKKGRAKADNQVYSLVLTMASYIQTAP